MKWAILSAGALGDIPQVGPISPRNKQNFARVLAKNETFKRAEKLGLLSLEDRRLVGEFVDSLGTLSKLRIEKYQPYIRKIGYELGKPLRQVTRPELVRYLNGVDASGSSEDTKRDIRLIAKSFFRWLRNEEFGWFRRLSGFLPRGREQYF